MIYEYAYAKRLDVIWGSFVLEIIRLVKIIAGGYLTKDEQK